jgi:hypothetical protein
MLFSASKVDPCLSSEHSFRLRKTIAFAEALLHCAGAKEADWWPVYAMSA